jgi:hypothetical protein
MTEVAVDSILKVLSGQVPENLVNPEAWGKRHAKN